MAIYCITGKPGNGKSTVVVDRAINEYLRNGRRVVANFHIDVAPVCVRRNGPLADANIQVLPAVPTLDDFKWIGKGGVSEEKAGALILDECGQWLNSRAWQAEERQKMIEFFLQSRKYFWDIFLVVQDHSLLDKQIRDAVVEMVGRCRRSDRKKVAGVSLPRMHICVIKYGTNPNDMIVDRWIYRGSDAHQCFNSYALFKPEEVEGRYSVLPPRLTKWRYIPIPAPLPYRIALTTLRLTVLVAAHLTGQVEAIKRLPPVRPVRALPKPA